MGKKEPTIEGLTPNYKLWLEYENEYVFGFGAFKILKSIQDTGTITEGAKALGMSYRYAWGVVRKIEKKLGVKLLDTFKGGTIGGGGAKVTAKGLALMKMFSKLNSAFIDVIESKSMQ